MLLRVIMAMSKSNIKNSKPPEPVFAEHKKPKSLVELRKILDKLRKQ